MTILDRESFLEMLQINIESKYKKELSRAFNITTIGTENKKIVFEKNSPEYNGLSISEIKEKIYCRIKRREFNELLKVATVDEDFLEEFAPVLDWDIVSEYQQLSEDFMTLFIKEIKWNKAILFQELSDEFLENIDHIFEVKDCSIVDIYTGCVSLSTINGSTIAYGANSNITLGNSGWITLTGTSYVAVNNID